MQIKEYLERPPILMPPIQGKPLILYILAMKIFLEALLVQKDEIGKERAIYYISCTFVAYELNYNSIENVCIVVVFAS